MELTVFVGDGTQYSKMFGREEELNALLKKSPVFAELFCEEQGTLNITQKEIGTLLLQLSQLAEIPDQECGNIALQLLLTIRDAIRLKENIEYEWT